jgi:hypothetical protein
MGEDLHSLIHIPAQAIAVNKVVHSAHGYEGVVAQPRYSDEHENKNQYERDDEDKFTGAQNAEHGLSVAFFSRLCFAEYIKKAGIEYREMWLGRSKIAGFGKFFGRIFPIYQGEYHG